jgi:hypothetical protein
MDLECFLVTLYVLVDEWSQESRPSGSRKRGRPPLLSDAEVLTLAILAQWLNLLIDTDFWLERVAEPRPGDETVRACADMQVAQVEARVE